ncbi:unnamed protein product [Ambrosiozyma monospora]|uniref:Unnamed protein product n=1 Tax=Ambrosiozyma monospora TaxID=43982 RepID=A0ACB5TA96_AMBMO|nr:unnamed protein product [Ambrosiozyma monospora]
MTDLASTQLLLDTLSKDLNSDVLDLINNNDSNTEEYLKFLNDFLVENDKNPDLLLSSEVKPSLDVQDAGVTLIEQIAELESRQRLLESKIQKTVYNNLDKILASTEVYKNSLNLFETDFNETCEFLSTNFNKDEEPESGDEDDDSASVSELPAHLKREAVSWKELFRQQQIQQRHLQQQQQDGLNRGELTTQQSSIILQNMDSIMDILELPALANACVKSGHYAECVEIAAHVRRLSIRYSDLPIIKKVESDIQLEIKEMVNGLIRLLNTDLKQSAIMKIITHLKRIGTFQEIDQHRVPSNSSGAVSAAQSDVNGISTAFLEKIFFKSRYQFILSELEILMPLKRSNSIEKYLKRCLEVIREHCFQTIMTFESIFTNKSASANSSTTAQMNNLLYSFVKSLILHL